MTLKVVCMITVILVSNAKQLLDQAMLDKNVVDPSNYFPKSRNT